MSAGLRWIYERRNLKEVQADLAGWLRRWQTRYSRLTSWAEGAIGETLRSREADHRALQEVSASSPTARGRAAARR